MSERSLLFWIVVAIATLTVATGAIQILWPSPILWLLAADRAPAALHFFGLVGMFMALFGGMLLHALFSGQNQPVVLLWAGLQKFGAVAGVGLGVLHGIFSPLALFVAGFDFISALLIFAYRSGASGR